MLPFLKITTALMALSSSSTRIPHPRRTSSRGRLARGTTAATIPNQQLEQEREREKKSLVTYEVCLSPGCIADGADETLMEMRALAPPHVTIREGVCHSLCGNGPVVLDEPGEGESGGGGKNNNKKNSAAVKRHRKVKGPKILELIYSEGSFDSCPTTQNLIRGFTLAREAGTLFDQKKYDRALELYEEAFEVGFGPAMELQAQREAIQPSSSSGSTGIPPALEWLIMARRNQALALLETTTTGASKDNDANLAGALFAAQSACNISRNHSPECFQVLAEVCRRKGDAAGEYQALQTMFTLFDQQQPPATAARVAVAVPIAVQNQRRELQFRLAKLERELSAKITS